MPKFLIILFACITAILFALGLLPFEALRFFLDALASDNDAETYTRTLHNDVSFRLLGAGIATFLTTLAFFLIRRCLGPRSTRMRDDWHIFRRKLASSFRAAFVEAGWEIKLSLAVILLAALGLRLCFLNDPLWHDEASTYVDRASLSLLKGLTTEASQFHPMAVLTMHFSIRLFGYAEWAIRLPMLIAGILAVPLSYWVGKVLYSRISGCIAASLVAVVYPLVTYSINGRGYAFGNIFFLITIGLVPYLARTRNFSFATIFMLAAGLANFSVQTMAFAFVTSIVFLGLTMLGLEGPRALYRIVFYCLTLSAGAVIITFAFFSHFWLLHGIAEMTVSNFVLRGAHTLSLMESVIAQLNNIWLHWSIGIPFYVLIMLGLAVVWASLTEKQTRNLIIASAASLIPYLMIVGSVEAPARIWQFLLFPVTLLIGVGINEAIGRKPASNYLRQAICPAFAAFSVWIAVENFQANPFSKGEVGRDLSELSKEFPSQLQIGDLILGDVVPGTFRYYLVRAALQLGGHVHYLPNSGFSQSLALQICPEWSSVVSTHATLPCHFDQPYSTAAAERKSIYLVTRLPVREALEMFADYGLDVPNSDSTMLVAKFGRISVFRF